jgi:hypothetical protein
MHPDEQLDALLTTQLRGHHLTSSEAPAVLVPLLDTAGRLETLRATQPTPAFARGLEEKLLARAELLAAERALTMDQAPSPAWSAPRDRGARRAHARRWKPLVAAAVLLFVVGAVTLTAAASAAPGTPLYGLHRLEQNVRAQIPASPIDQGTLHLAYADQALAALETAINHHDIRAYRDALATLRQELTAAREALRQLPPGPARDGLASAIAQRSLHAQQVLLAALPNLTWTDQLMTTQALGELGAPVPSISRAQVIAQRRGDQAVWLVSLTGSGFQPGAQLVLNGQSVGSGGTPTGNRLQIELDNPPSAPPITLGIENLDGTAAETETIEIVTPQGNADIGSGSAPTATPGSHAGGSGQGGGGKHGENTPTPSVNPPHSPASH